MESILPETGRSEKVRKVAKIWAGVVITLAVIWIIMELVFPHPDPSVEGPLPPFEWVLISLMLLTFVGLLLAFRWELWGSLLTLVCAGAFTAILSYQDRLNEPLAMIVMMLVIAFPALLFLWSWNLDRNREALSG